MVRAGIPVVTWVTMGVSVVIIIENTRFSAPRFAETSALPNP
jgi:hypothetical protein